MKLFNGFFVYPWTSYRENNCNTMLIDGPVPTLIDPGHSHLFHTVVEAMARDGKSVEHVKLVLCTHGHPDHIETVDYFEGNVLKAISADELQYLGDEGKDMFLMSGCQAPRKPFHLLLKAGDFALGDKEFQVIPTPGHSPGSLCLYWKKEKLLISGDTLFYMGVGRTDLPGGDMEALGESIRKLSELDIEYLIPGHGEMIRGSESIRRNFDVILSEFF